MIIENLLIIGNGFDLKCELKSSYNDFFNSKLISDKQNLVTTFYESFGSVFNIDFENFDYSLYNDIDIYDRNLDMFKSKIVNLTEDTTWNFWNMIFKMPKNMTKDWNDIEKKIEDIVCNSEHSHINMDRINNYYIQLLKIDSGKTFSEQIISPEQQDNLILAIYT